MKKAQKETKVKKNGKPLKDFLPPNLKSAAREYISLKPVENFNRNFVPFYEAHSIPEEWPSEEDLKVIEHIKHVDIRLRSWFGNIFRR